MWLYTHLWSLYTNIFMKSFNKLRYKIYTHLKIGIKSFISKILKRDIQSFGIFTYFLAELDIKRETSTNLHWRVCFIFSSFADVTIVSESLNEKEACLNGSIILFSFHFCVHMNGWKNIKAAKRKKNRQTGKVKSHSIATYLLLPPKNTHKKNHEDSE